MVKSVLLISSTARKGGGNSGLLCDAFAKGARDAGHRAEKVCPGDKHINYCTGCGACLEEGCPCLPEDDMPRILDQMTRNDVIVMATPVDFYTMSPK